MKFGRGTLIFVMAASLASFSQVPTSSGSAPKSKIVQLKVKSPEKDFPIRSVYVMTPAVPANQVALLPIVYMLHGWPGSPSGLIAGVQAPLETAFAQGAAPFIAVFPDGNALTHSDSEWADSYDGRAKIETWLTTVVIQTVEAGNIRTRADRAILGFSMGGYGAAIIGLHHPELYGQVVTLAGYFVLDDLSNAFGLGVETDAKHTYQNPLTFLKTAKKSRWFLGESHDDYTPLIRGQAANWATKLKSVKATYATNYAPGGHSYVFVANEIPSVLKWFRWATVSPPLKVPTPLPSNSQSSLPIPSPTPSVHAIFN